MILSYSIISAIILGFGYIAYRLTMAEESQHRLNRLALQMIYAVALLSPMILLPVMLHHPTAETEIFNMDVADAIGGIGVIVGQEEVGTSEPLSSTRFIGMIYQVYIIGAVIFAAYFIFGLFMLLRIIRRGEKTEFEGYNLILVDDSCKTAPFSWGHSIVMTRSDYEQSGEMILLHEHSHLSYRHWIDVLTAYVAICLQWYNPAAWAMREDLKAVHEYQADEMVLSEGVDAKEYQMLLLNKAVGYGYQSLANSLNHSKLRKRVTMMYKKKTSLQRRLFALALIPAIGAGITVTSIPSVAGVLESLAMTSSSSLAEMEAENKIEFPEQREVFTTVETIPEFPGGMPSLMQFLAQNIRYPEEAHKNNEQGRVIAKFIVEKDGSIGNIEIVRGISKSLDKEAVRVLKEMPKWIPGKNNGTAVACYFTIPISFKLQENTPKQP